MEILNITSNKNLFSFKYNNESTYNLITVTITLVSLIKYIHVPNNKQRGDSTYLGHKQSIIQLINENHNPSEDCHVVNVVILTLSYCK